MKLFSNFNDDFQKFAVGSFLLDYLGDTALKIDGYADGDDGDSSIKMRLKIKCSNISADFSENLINTVNSKAMSLPGVGWPFPTAKSTK
jgi:hypothetical protein